jgi:hypothetical protein
VARGDLQLPHAGWGGDVTLDDVSCLMHLSNEGRLSDYEYVGREEGMRLMVDLIGSDPADAVKETTVTKGSHVRHTYLQGNFKTLLGRIVEYTVEANQDEVLRYQNFAVMTYLLLLVGFIIFADTSKNCVHLHHLKNFDDLETASEIAWAQLRSHAFTRASLPAPHPPSALSQVT